MLRRLVSLAAVLAVIAPTTSACVFSPTFETAPAAIAAVHADPLRSAPVADLVARLDIPWSRFQLDNGLTVMVHEDRKAPVVAVSIWYNSSGEFV